MRNILAIWRRELLSFFVSPVAYFVITGFVLLGAYFYFTILFYFNVMLARYNAMPYAFGQMSPNLNQLVVEPYFKTLIVILVFLIPLLTMRVIAEEKKSGTFELLVTSPVTVRQIVLGKFLGLATVVVAMMLLVFALPALLFVYGEPGPEPYPVFSGLLGLTLIGISFAAIGMAVSSFTENQIVAGISSMVVLLLLYVVHSPAESLDGVAKQVLEALSPLMQSEDLMRGVISLKSIVYFASLIVLGMFASERALEAHRWR